MKRWHLLPAQLYTAVEQTPGTVLLESAAPADSQPTATPLSRLFTAPLRVSVANHPAELPALFAEIERAVAAGLYAAGYFSYECAAFFEPKLAASAPTPIQRAQPLAWLGIYQSPHIFDHQAGAFRETATEAPCPIFSAPPGGKGGKAQPPLDCTLALTEPEYTQRIESIHELIRSGDVYQLNFTVPIRVRAPGSSAALYQRLRSRQPAPYGAFLHTLPGQRILSFSPELFFRIETEAETRRITTRPMKGTAPRGRTAQEDRAQAHWLANDPKNRAENVMIVDLLRNDLGRLCAFGSVRVQDLFAVERYPTLWQMTSTVTGQLRPEAGFQQIFRALFPCGSVTGAPKIRAIQLLSQLEGQPRGVYTGAIGFFSAAETVFNVAIRTLTLHGDQGVMGVGSGIVIDSNPAAEFRECLLKAEFLTASSTTAASFSLVETMLWQGDYPLLELHLDRLEDSAHYFAYPFNRAQAKAALESHAAALAKNLGALGLASETWDPGAPSLRRSSVARVGEHDPQPTPANSLTRNPRAAGANSPPLSETPRKVRLLLNPDGSLHIVSEPITPIAHPLRIRIAAQRTDPSDPMYFHKTTHRPLYARALQAATEAGYDDVLFLNRRGEVTEAAIHNIFIEKAGKLLTPPIECGLLPGVHRRHILATNPNAEERILHIEDLQQADQIYLSNAVRGLRSAVIDWETP